MIRYLLSLWPSCGAVGRKNLPCGKPLWHTGRHKYPSAIERQLVASIDQAKARKEATWTEPTGDNTKS